MKFSIAQDVFIKALQRAADVAARRTTVPILTHVMLEASADGTLTLVSTDLEQTLVETCPIQLETPGTTTVPAQLLRDVVTKLQSKDMVQLSLDDNTGRLTIESRKSVFQLPTLPSVDYPTIQEVSFPCSFTITSKDFARLINMTAFSMAQDETRFYMNGIYMHISEGTELRAVATDGHRLSKVRIDMPSGSQDMPGVIISRKTVNELQGFLKDAGAETPILIAVSPTMIRFQTENLTLLSRLVDGTFPDYERVIPKDHNKSLLVQAGEFAQAVDRVALLARDKTRGIKLFIDKDQIRFAADGSDYGMANDAMTVDYQSDPINLAFNATYLLDVANALPGDSEAEILMSEEGRPVMIRQHMNTDALYVIMPMRI